jgi:hypothetical protein
VDLVSALPINQGFLEEAGILIPNMKPLDSRFLLEIGFLIITKLFVFPSQSPFVYPQLISYWILIQL